MGFPEGKKYVIKKSPPMVVSPQPFNSDLFSRIILNGDTHEGEEIILNTILRINLTKIQKS